jgi:HEPN domain-containing protein
MPTESDRELDITQVVAFWTAEAEEALVVAHHLVAKADYSYALFFGHLALEKMLKALYVFRQERHAPPLHNLLRLARAAKLEVDEAKAEQLTTITAFNLEARYPDYKRSFRQTCTPEYTTQQMAMIEELMQWLRSQLPSAAA